MNFFSSFNSNWALTSLPERSFKLATWLISAWAGFFASFNNNWYLERLPEWSFDMSHITSVGSAFLSDFNRNWKLIYLPNSFKLSSKWSTSYYGYKDAFNSSNYTLNRNVSDLVAWITVPSSDMNTFSDNQPWRCGVHANWLVSPAWTCGITLTFNVDGWIEISSMSANSWDTIILPNTTKTWNVLVWWYDSLTGWNKLWDAGDQFVVQSSQTLYAHWLKATTLLPGQQFNSLLKSNARWYNTSYTSYTTNDTYISRIQRRDWIPSRVTENDYVIVSTQDSYYPVYAWYDNGAIHYYTEADKIYLNEDSSSMFYNMSNLQNIEMDGWDTSNVTNMGSMFSYCSNLANLDLSNWDTSNVTNMSWMFSYCNNLTNLDVSNWDTSKVTSMGSMFYKCSRLAWLDVSSWNTSNVTNMGQMFSNCASLTSLDLSNFDTSKVTNMGNMFTYCSSLTSLDVSNWDTSNVTSTNQMFYQCSKLINLNLSGWDTSNITDMGHMFRDCKSLTELNLNNWDTSKVTSMNYMFYNCNNLKTIYVSTWFVTNQVTSHGNMFSSDTKLVGWNGTKFNSSYTNKTLAKIDNHFQSWYFTNIAGIYVNFMVDGRVYTSSVVGYGDRVSSPSINPTKEWATFKKWINNDGQDYDFNIGIKSYTEIHATFNSNEATLLPWQEFNKIVKRLAGNASATYSNTNTTIKQIVQWTWNSIPSWITTWIISTLTSDNEVVAWYSNGTIYYYTEAEKIYLNEDSSYMFYYMQWLTWLDMSWLDTSRVTNMSYMFSYCTAMAGLNLTNFDTKSVTNMSYMFNGATALTSLDLSSWNTSNVWSMRGMFYNANKLTSLNLSGWDTSNVTDMSWMFQTTSALMSLNLSGWDTSSVTNMSYMFRSTSALPSLDISNWDTSSVTNMVGMFQYSNNLTSLDISNWNTSNVTNMGSMFEGDSALTSLNISNWDTSSVTNMNYMFYNCNNLWTIYASTWFVTNQVTSYSNMFTYDTNLVWWNGTKFDSNYIDKARAKVDNQSQVWYFTDKTAITVRFRTPNFNANPSLTNKTVSYWSSVTPPENPQAFNATFSGWYLPWEDTLFDFSTPITGYTELHAKWKCNTGYAMNEYGTMCGSGVVVHFDTDGWTELEDMYIASWSALTRWVTKYLHTSNLDDYWSQIAWKSYPTYTTLIDSATIAKAPTIHVKITYQMYYNSTSNRISIYDGSVTPTTSNYASSISNRLYSNSKTIREYDVPWDTVQILFQTSYTTSSYYGYYAIVTWRQPLIEGDPIKSWYVFRWWKLAWSDEYFDLSTPITWDTTLYAQWEECVWWVVVDNECIDSAVVTYDTNGWQFDDGDTVKSVSYLWDDTMATTTDWKTPSKAWNSCSGMKCMFDGWYLWTGENAVRWTGYVDGVMRVYAKWLPFEDLTITRNGVSFTIMDRNLWATASWVWCTLEDDSTCGYHFQWWNNYGFKPCNTSNCNTFPNWEVPISNAATDFADHVSTYYNWQYRYNSQWNNASYGNGNNLWWWMYSSNPDEDKQWPCPAWYHVPDMMEWQAVWTLLNEWWDVYRIRDVLKLPFAGFRSYASNYNNYAVTAMGSNGLYWSSTPITNSAYYFYFNSASDIGRQNVNNRSYGSTVRCFQNSSSKSLTYQLNWWSVEWDLPTEAIRRWEDGIELEEPTKTWYGFGWWYTTSWFDEWTRVTTNAISSDDNWGSITLYAKWEECGQWQIIVNYRCKTEKVVTYDTNGWAFNDGATVKNVSYYIWDEWELIWTTDWKTPSKVWNTCGWKKCMFDGWYLSTWSNAAKWTWYLTDDLRVYAKWLPFEDLTITRNGVSFTIMDRNLWATASGTGCVMGDFQCYAWWEWMWYQDYNECYQSCSDIGPVEKWVSVSKIWSYSNDDDYCVQQCTPILRWYESYEECSDEIENDYERCVLWWYSESDFWCSEGWSGHGFESYENCYESGLDFGASIEEIEWECTPNLHGYENIDQCWDAMEDEYSQHASASMGVNWDYFQWWNNYGFKPNYALGWWFLNGENVTSDYATDSDNHMSTYYRWIFVTSSPWFNDSRESDYYNLWWWSDSYNSDEDKQWPCPAWYHVPTSQEWYAAKGAFYDDSSVIYGKSSSSSNRASEFRKTLKLPIAGYIDFQGWYLENNPYDWMGAYRSATNDWAGSSELLHLGSSYADVYEFNVSYATSVRCFKNSATNLILETNGADGMMWEGEIEGLLETTIFVTWWVAKRWDSENVWTLPEPIKSGHGFMGWYTTSWFEAWTKVTTNALSAEDGGDTVTVYAKWKYCGEWYIIKNNRCVSERAWVVNTGGLIKVSNGEKTIYVKDRNVWATVSQWIPDIIMYQYLINLKAEELNNLYPEWNYWYNSYDYYQFNDQLCEYASELVWINFDSYEDIQNYLYNPLYYMFVNYRQDVNVEDLMYRQKYWMWLTPNEEATLLSIIESVTWIDFESIDDAVDYMYNLYDNYNPLNPEFGDEDIDSFGNYYRWWNDVWITYDELWVWECYTSYGNWGWGGVLAKSTSTKAVNSNNSSTSFVCTSDPYLDEWHEWFWDGADMDNEWWNEWSHDNPCDASKWEYLPTPEDWKQLMGLWWEINGYGTSEWSDGDYSYYQFNDSLANLWFMQDMWIPLAWDVDTNNGTWTAESSLWTAKDAGGYLGRYLGKYMWMSSISAGWWGPKKGGTKLNDAGSSNYDYGVSWWLEYGTEYEADSIVMPIRCFVRLPIITYDANGWVFSGWQTIFSKQYTWDVTITEWVSPIKTWNTCDWKKCMFDGWYLWTWSNAAKWTWYLKEDMTVYAKWLPFEDIDAYFISDTWAISYITLMDRNLWAISDNISSTWSYGNHYQRWNNYGFQIWCWGGTIQNNFKCSDFVTENSLRVRYYGAVWDDSYNNKWYNGSQFIRTSWNSPLWAWLGPLHPTESESDYWSWDLHYDGLRWWSGDSISNYRWIDTITSSNIVNRQWPCPEWYHVPSFGEWKKLLERWSDSNNDNFVNGINTWNWEYLDACMVFTCYDSEWNEVECDEEHQYESCEEFYNLWEELQRNFNVPFADWRSSDAQVSLTNYTASLWSSSPDPDNLGTSFVLALNSDTINSDDSWDRIGGNSVRCFSNDYMFNQPSMTIHPNGWTGAMILVEWDTIKSLWTPHRDSHSTFEGWYSTSGFAAWSEVITWIVAPANLYAKWSCATGYTDNGVWCVDITLPTITFDQQSGAAANSHSVEITATDIWSKLVQNWIIQNADGYTITYNWELYTLALNDIDWYYYWWNNYPTSDTAHGWNNSNIWVWSANNNTWWWGSDNQNNWWWANVTNPEDRQWPCQDWYHVPSRWERQSIFTAWCHLPDNNCSDDDLNNIAMDGYASHNWLWTEFMQDFGMLSDGYQWYWSSSQANNDYRAWAFLVDDNTIQPRSYEGRSNSYKVRCVKNSNASSTLKYRWQTDSTCSSDGSDYTSTSRGPYANSWTTATATVTTSWLNDGSYYLCVLSWSILDNAWNTNITTKTEWTFIVDNGKPIWSLTGTNVLKSTSQRLTWTCTDTLWVIAIYLWTKSTPTASDYTTIASVTTYTTWIDVTAAWTYYLYCKDVAWNISTWVSQVYNSYKINNMLVKASWTIGTYNTSNYAQDSTYTYIAPNGTTLDISSIFTVPTYSNSNRYIGFSTGAASTTAATIDTWSTSIMLNSNVTYSIWFSRNVISFRYVVRPGESLTATTTAADGTVYTRSKDSNNYIMRSINWWTAAVLVSSVRVWASIDLANYNNTKYINIKKTWYTTTTNKEWICITWCTVSWQEYRQTTTTIDSTNSCPTIATNDCNIDIWVNWKNATYKVTLNGNWATTAWTASVTATYDKSTLSPATITLPVRQYVVSYDMWDSWLPQPNSETGVYTFLWWYTKTSGGYKVLSESTTPVLQPSVSSYTNASGNWISAGAKTLYAHWSNTSASITLPTLEKAGYTCKWAKWSTGWAQTVWWTSVIPTANTTYYAVCVDDIPPEGDIATIRRPKTSTQAAYISCDDGVGVTEYYRWTGNAADSDYISITSTTHFATWVTVNSTWNYRLYCKDAAGNRSSAQNAQLYSYTVYNIEENADGITTSYDNNNYTAKSIATYTAWGWISTTPAEIYENPNSSCDTLMWVSANLIPPLSSYNAAIYITYRDTLTIDSNVTYGMWFKRNTYQLSLVPWTGVDSVIGSWIYKWWKSVEIDAMVKDGYTFSGWTKVDGIDLTTFTSTTKNQNVEMACGDVVLRAEAKDITAPVCTWWEPSKTLLKGWQIGTIVLTCTDGVWIATNSLNSSDITYSSSYVTLSNAEVWWTETWRTYTFTYTAKANINGDVTFTLLANKVSDSAWNKNSVTWPSSVITVDNTKPVCTWWEPSKTPIRWWQTWTIVLTCTDAVWISTSSLNSSDITYSSSYVTLSNAEVWWTGTWRTYTFTYTAKANTNWQTTFKLPASKVKDIAWNFAATKTSSAVRVDNAVPILSADNFWVWWNDDIEITLSASDNNGLNYSKYSWISASDCVNNWTTFVNGETITYTTEWTKTLYLCAEDLVWNTNTWNGMYYLDRTSPNISFDKQSGAVANSHSVEITATDTLSNLATGVYTNPDWSKTLVWSGINLTIAWENLPGVYQWWTTSANENYSTNNNAWWWINDTVDNGYSPNPTNFDERQWPCPSWYHVPSLWERNSLAIAWCNLDEDCNPGVNIRTHSIWWLIEINWWSLGEKLGNELNLPQARYWASSSDAYSKTYYFWVYQSYTTFDYHNLGSSKYPVRCFKNSTVEIPRLKYRWQTDSTCSSNGSDYAPASRNSYAAWDMTTTATVTTEWLVDGEYYLCVLSWSISDNAWNTNITTKTSGQFIVDNTKPTWSLTGTNTLKSTSQRLTWTCEDVAWVTAIYLWTNSSPLVSDYKAITSTTSYTTWMNISSAWTYYLFCKDTAWNISTWKSITYNSYSVQNMIDKIIWTQWTYNTTNYETNGSLQWTYIISSGSTIPLNSGSLYGDPIQAKDSYAGWTMANSGTLTYTNPTLTANTTYYRWFNRDYYDLELRAGTWISAVSVSSDLPDWYTRVEYIKSDGNQYIDTNLNGYMGYKYELVFQQDNTANSRVWWVFGQQSYVGTNMSITWSSWRMVRWESVASNQRGINNIDTLNTNKHTIVIDDWNITYDWVSKWRSAGHNSDFVIEKHIYLFTANPGDTTPTSNMNGKIYSYKVWNNSGMMIQNFVPCKNSNGVYWMYDVIWQVFYPSIWSAQFTWWPEVTWRWTYKYGATPTIVATPNTASGYVFSGWTINEWDAPVSAISASTAVTITQNTILTANAKDTTKPIWTITTTNDVNATSQTATLNCTDNVGVTEYYRWTSNNPADNAYTPITSTTNFSTTKTVNASWTYYLYCKDVAWNVSNEVSKRYVAFKVKNMLDKIEWDATKYNITNYDVNSTMPWDSYYIIPGGTTLTLTNRCTPPRVYSTTRKRTSVWEPSTTVASSTTITSAANTTYVCWYARNTHSIMLIKNTWIDKIYYKLHGESNYSVTNTTKSISVKAWSVVYLYATAANCYTCASTCKSLETPSMLGPVTTNQTYSPTATENTNNITYNLNWWTNNASNPATYKVTQLPIVLQQPTKTWYTFLWWTGSNGNIAQTSVTIAAWSCGNKTYNAVWQANTYNINYNLSDGTHGASYGTTATYDQDFTVSNPTRVWYTFLWWRVTDMDNVIHTIGTGTTTATSIASTLATLFRNLTSTSGAIVNFEALWSANTNTQYVVYHYVKRVWQSTYELSDTETKYWTTDATLILSSLARENVFTCAHYDRWSLTWTESWPWEVVTQTTIRWDGTTKIYLYYVRDYYNVYLTGDEHVDILKINGVETEHAVLECGSEVPVDAIPQPWYHFVRWDKEERERRLEEGEEETK